MNIISQITTAYLNQKDLSNINASKFIDLYEKTYIKINKLYNQKHPYKPGHVNGYGHRF